MDRDGDADMGGPSGYQSRPRYNPGYHRRPGGNKGKFGNNSAWWKIVVHEAQKFDQTHFFRMLDQTTNENIDPKNIKLEKNKLVFWVKNHRAKDAIMKQSGKLTLKDHTINLFAKPSQGPESELSADDLKAKICTVLEGRYSVIDKKLDLSEFNRDKDLNGIRAQLFVISNVIGELIKEKCADSLEEIDFSRNMLKHTGCIRTILSAAKNVTRVSFEYNMMNSETDLKALSEHCPNLTHLSLKENPAKKLMEEAKYIAGIRRLFPKLIHLDDLPLPEKISFEDDEDEVKLPATKQSTILLDPLPRQALERFFLKYIEIHDGGKGNRASLVHAYHEKCLFSVACSWRTRSSSDVKSKFPMKMPLELSKKNRNFRHVTKAELRESRLIVGRDKVVAEVNDMGDTKHISHSLCIDTSTLEDNFVTAVLTGVMDCQTEYRSFSRTFILCPVPETSSYLITNDQLSVVRTDHDLLKKIESVPGTAPSTSGVSAPTPGYTPEQEALIARVGAATKMTRSACIQLLTAAQGDYNQALAKFAEMKNAGQIPANFFLSA